MEIRIRMKTTFMIFLGMLVLSWCSRAGPLDTWTIQNSGTTNDLNAITYGASTFVVVGDDGTILTSTNGADWAAQSSGTANNLYGITYANGIFVAVGGSIILNSADGDTWTAVTTVGRNGGQFPVADLILYSVTYGDGLYVAVGGGGAVGPEIVTSTNGTTWNLLSSPGASGSAITYANGIFAAVGANALFTSTNGTNWSSPVHLPLWGITFGDNQFVAVGGDSPAAPGGVFVTSPNGTTWSEGLAGTGANLFGIAWGNGSFVTVGGYGGPFGQFGGGTVGFILSSANAITWVNQFEETNSSLNGVVYGNGSFVAVGNNGTILQSGPIFTVTGSNQFANGGFALNLVGQIGRGYRIQTSTNLADSNWTDLIDFTNTTETMQFLDTSATNYSERFYRVATP